MKTKLIAAGIVLAAAVAIVIAQSLPISRFPNTPTPNDSDLFVLAQTQAPATNKNIRYDQLRGAIRSGLATETFVNTVSNILAANAGFARLEVQTNTVRLGLITNINWTYGMTGSVSSTTAILGIDDSLANSNLSNSIFGMITTASNTFAFNRTNQFTTNIAGTPVNGKVVLQGFPGVAFATNNARTRTWEWDPTNQSLIAGSVGNLGVVNHQYLASSNFLDFPNVGFMTTIRGSNCLANADFSFVHGDRNTIYTNAQNSFIASGSESSIRTNASNSFIGSGVNGVISVNARGSFIGGGQDALISGGSQFGVIVGGFGNGFRSGGALDCFIGGGLNNDIGRLGEASGSTEYSSVVGGNQNICRGDYAFIGGGRLNNMLGNDDFSTIVGGDGNSIGLFPNPSVNAFIGGGGANSIENNCDYATISGGRSGTISANSSNAVIDGGYLNSIAANGKFSTIPGGERNSVSANYSFALGGGSNNVTAARAGAVGMNVTNNVADSVVVGNLVDYRQIEVVAGAGNGNTNYTLQAISPVSYLGSSNVNIVAMMQTVPGRVHRWTVNITNLSAINWGFSWPQTTNRVKWQSWMYGTNAPSVLTNNTILKLDGVSEGTNTLVEFKYFSPAL